MTTDSLEARIGRLEQSVAKLEQRVDDLLDRLAGQFKDLDDDVRAFAPIVREVDSVKAELRYIIKAQQEAQKTLAEAQQDTQRAIGDLRMRMEQEAKARAQGQEKRRKEDRTNRTLLWVAAIGLVGLVLESAAILLAGVL